MREHPEIGYRILAPILALANVVPGVRFHHESYNGRGYPMGLQGEAIPLVARIIAVADSFDAMTTDRPYRPAFTLDVVKQTLVRGRGVQWDGQVVDCMMELFEECGFWDEFQLLRRNPPSSPVFESAGTRFLRK
jgi:HD-GYP domain-containing protein (c-di-GMP phosphodiesterase class II)